MGKVTSKKSGGKASTNGSSHGSAAVGRNGRPVAGKAGAGKVVAAAAKQAKPTPAKGVAAKPAVAKAAAAKPGSFKPVAAAAGKASAPPRPAGRPVVAAPAPAKGKPVPAAAAPPTGRAPAKAVAAPTQEARTDARANRAQKPVRVESKPDRPVPLVPSPPPPPRVEPVSSSGDSKPKKNQAGLSNKELEFFRDLLLEKRRELIGDMNTMEREALQSGDSGLSTLPIHMADMGTDNYEQEFTLGLVEKDRVLLREINHALAKVQNGTYGICEGNGNPITKVRLEAQPWARHSIEFVRSHERNGMRR